MYLCVPHFSREKLKISKKITKHVLKLAVVKLLKCYVRVMRVLVKSNSAEPSCTLKGLTYLLEYVRSKTSVAERILLREPCRRQATRWPYLDINEQGGRKARSAVATGGGRVFSPKRRLDMVCWIILAWHSLHI